METGQECRGYFLGKRIIRGGFIKAGDWSVDLKVWKIWLNILQKQ